MLRAYFFVFLMLFSLFFANASFASKAKKPPTKEEKEKIRLVVHNAWEKGMENTFNSWVRLSKNSQSVKDFYSNFFGLDSKHDIFKKIDPEVKIPVIVKIPKGVEIHLKTENPFTIVMSEKFGEIDFNKVKPKHEVQHSTEKNSFFALDLFSLTFEKAHAGAVDWMARLGLAAYERAALGVSRWGGAREPTVSNGTGLLRLSAGMSGTVGGSLVAAGCVLGMQNGVQDSNVQNCSDGAYAIADNAAAYGVLLATSGASAVGVVGAATPVGRAARAAVALGGVGAIMLYGIPRPGELLFSSGRLECTSATAFRFRVRQINNVLTTPYSVSSEGVSYETSLGGRSTIGNNTASWISFLRQNANTSGLSEDQLNRLAEGMVNDINAKTEECRRGGAGFSRNIPLDEAVPSVAPLTPPPVGRQ
ncbi:MAG: hypothetical protein ACK5P5_11060 [Pseudobdellovibrionaceae bacterium]